MATYIQGQSWLVKQVNITPLFVYISPEFPEYMICSTLFSTDRGSGIDVDLLEWVIAHEKAWSYLLWVLWVVHLRLVFTESGRWKLWEEGRRKKRQAIKSPAMAYTDLDSGPPSLYCSCLKEKHHVWLPGVKFSSSKSFILSCFSARGGVSVHTLASWR